MSPNKKLTRSPLLKDTGIQTNLSLTKSDRIVRNNSKLYTFYDYIDQKKESFNKNKSDNDGPKLMYDKRRSLDSSAHKAYSDLDDSEDETQEEIIQKKYIVRRNESFKPKHSLSENNMNIRRTNVYDEYHEDDEENEENYYLRNRRRPQFYVDQTPKNMHIKEKIVYVESSSPKVSMIPQLQPSNQIIYQAPSQPITQPIIYQNNPNQVIVSRRPSQIAQIAIAPINQPLQNFARVPVHVPVQHNTQQNFRRHSYTFR
ncbi:unnamed protein product [Brachionus calyciflorus]|uniref:Uncharacterized protein n=1 Tax=Brachionus calyciflorus TaxID=104777 RepID=A0A814CF18_9BILA|nr:unnamed protein product [Brachionus calyciflorus]